MLVFAIVVALVLLCTACVVLLGIAAQRHPKRRLEVIEHVDIWAGFDQARRGWEVRHKLEQAEDIAVFEAPVTAEYVGRIS